MWFRDWPLAPSKAPQQLHRRHRLFWRSATLAAPPPLLRRSTKPSRRPCWDSGTIFFCGFETDLWHPQRLRSSSWDDTVFFYAQPPLQHRHHCSVPAPDVLASLLALRHNLFLWFRDWPLAPSKAPQQLLRRHRPSFSTLSRPCSTAATAPS